MKIPKWSWFVSLIVVLMCAGFMWQQSGRPGDPFPSNPYGMMGSDGTNGRAIHTDVNGNIIIAPATGTAGAVDPVQGATLFNTQATSAANTQQTLAVTGAAGSRSVLRAATGVVSAAGTCTVTVQDGATPIMTLPPLTSTTTVSLFPSGFAPATGISASTGNSLNLVIGACGVGVTSTVAIVGDRQ